MWDRLRICPPANSCSYSYASKIPVSTIVDTMPGLLWYVLFHSKDFTLFLPIIGKSVQYLGQRERFRGFSDHYCRNDVGSKVDQSKHPCYMETV